MHNKPSIYFSNLLIILSLLGFIFIYYPFFKILFFNKPPKVEAAANEESIYIPKIEAYAPLIKDVDPWNKYEYSKALEKGVAVAKGSVGLGEVGRVFMFAHSSQAPWNITRYNTPFLLLPRLKVGDEIIVNNQSTKYIYKVVKSLIINPNDTNVLETKTDKKELVLQTCTPPGTDLKRLLVFAELVE